MADILFDDIKDTFSFLDNWEDKYRYIIDLGKTLPAFPDDARTENHRVRGCASQVWLITDATKPQLHFHADSDAHIVRGLVAIVLSLFNNKTADEILNFNADQALQNLGLQNHLTAQRANGVAAMITRIKQEAAKVQNIKI